MKHMYLRNWTKRSKFNPDTDRQLFCSNFPARRKIRNSILFTIILIGFTQVCWGQSKGDYRSIKPGDWNDLSVWEYCSVGVLPGPVAWIGAQVVPSSSAKLITIRNLHTITTGEICTAKALTIESGGLLIVNAGGQVNVSGVTSLGSSQCIILKSNAVQTGSFTFNTISGSGSVKVERFMSKSDLWHLYCSPISNQSIHNFLMNNPQIPDLKDGSGNVIGVGMRQYLTNLDSWETYIVYGSTDGGGMANAKGFSIRGYNTDGAGTGLIYATGIPNPNDFNVALTRTSDPTDQGWNLIGNPFLCAINLFDNTLTSPCFFDDNFGSIDPAFLGAYIWDSSKSEYAIINYTSDYLSVQMGQGFFVKSILGGGIVRFSKTHQFPDVNLTFKTAKIKHPSITLLIHNQNYKSSTEIKFIINTTQGLDYGYDAGMLKINPDFALYSKLLKDNLVDFGLQCLPDKDYDQYVIPIGIDFKAGGDLTFTAETVNLSVGCQAVLEDRLTKQFTRLDLKDAKYTANVSADTKGIGRFFLHTSDVTSGDQPIEKEQFKINKIGKILYINGEVSGKANFFVYSVNGKQLANFKAESQIQNQFDASGLPAGVYILAIDDQNKKKSTKFIIEN